MRRASEILAIALLASSVIAWKGSPPPDQTFWSWFALPALSIAAVPALAGLGRLLERKPGWLSVPDRKAFEALSEDRKREVARSSQGLLDWVALELVLISSLIQISMYTAQPDDSFSPMLIVVLAFACVVSPAVAMVYVGRIQSETKRLLREQQQAGS